MTTPQPDPNDFTTRRDTANQYPCEDCGAQPGTTCTNIAKGVHHGEPLQHQTAHLSRRKNAGLPPGR